MEEDKGIVYGKRVLVGNWYETIQLEEYKLSQFLTQMKRGDLLLARYRKMSENLNKQTVLTQTATTIAFGDKITLLAPYVPSTDPPSGKLGLLLGGYLNSNNIMYSQDLEDGCNLVGLTLLKPVERNTFIITSSDYCNRDSELIKYNQEFLLMLAKSKNKKPLYVRYDPDPFPGVTGIFPLYLSDKAVSNTRWRILPKQNPNLTRFEQEGRPVPVNTDIVINHCSTNINLAFDPKTWRLGFHGKVCAAVMKTCLDVYKCELPNNIWQIYIPISSDEQKE